MRLAPSPGRCEITRRQLGQAALGAKLSIGTAQQACLEHLDARGIAVRAGDLAALPLLKRFGVNAAARASCYLYTQTAELDRLTAALHELTHSRGKESR